MEAPTLAVAAVTDSTNSSVRAASFAECDMMWQTVVGTS